MMTAYPVRFTTDAAKMRTVALYLSWELRVESERVAIELEPCISACIDGWVKKFASNFLWSNLYPRLIRFLDALKIEY